MSTRLRRRSLSGRHHVTDLDAHRVAMVNYVEPVAVAVVDRLRPLVDRQLHGLGAGTPLDLHVADRAVGTQNFQVKAGLQVACSVRLRPPQKLSRFPLTPQDDGLVLRAF